MSFIPVPLEPEWLIVKVTPEIMEDERFREGSYEVRSPAYLKINWEKIISTPEWKKENISLREEENVFVVKCGNLFDTIEEVLITDVGYFDRGLRWSNIVSMSFSDNVVFISLE